MEQTRELSFALERFEWAADDRLEVSGRWQGLTGRRLARPVLTVETEGRRRRLTAMPGGQLPGKGGEAWRASFAWPHGPADVESAVLQIGRSVVVELPAPRRRKRRAHAPVDPAPDEGLRSELAELRAQIAELRSARESSPEAEAVAESAEAVADSAEAEAEHEELRARLDRLQSEHDELREQHERLRSDHEGLGEEHERLRSEHDSLGDQHAALIARSGDLRGQLAEAMDAQEPLAARVHELEAAKGAADADRERLAQELEALRATLAERDRELAGHREDAEQRLGAERAATGDVREKLAGAREEARKALADEAAETERIRAELAAARELERERATARQLRRDLDAKSAEKAKHRRSMAATVTNGVHTTTDETPVAATPAGRAGRRAAAVLASRAEAEARTPYRRVDAARAAAAQRVPEHEHSATGVWVARAAALALVALLLIALAIIVSSVA